MKHEEKSKYLTPEVELVTISVEQGFAGSTNFEDPTKDDSYADDTDFWG